MWLTLTRQASCGRVLKRRTAGGKEQVAGPDGSLKPKDAGHRPPVTGHPGSPDDRHRCPHFGVAGTRPRPQIQRVGDLNNLPEVREPARRRDVALETDDPGQELCSDQP